MEELSNPLQTPADNNTNYSNPSFSMQSEMCGVNVAKSSDDSTKTNDQVDASSKNVKTSTLTNFGCKEDISSSSSSRGQHLGMQFNYTDAQKSSTFKQVKNSTSFSNSELKSRHEPQSTLCPHVNCPEKIIICLDLNEEMDTTVFRSRAGDKYTGLELAKRTIKMFVLHKTQMNPKNEFAFVIFHEESTMIHSFTLKAQDMLNTLDEIEIETHKSGPLNISHMFETIKENIELPVVNGDLRVIPPPFIVRVILVFGRSHCVPIVTSTEAQRELESSPYFFTDVLYVHNPPSEDNKCEEIFHTLCELDHNGMSYIFEQSKYTPILNSGAKLLAHPLQRPRQLEAMYKISASVPNAAPATLAE